MSEKTRVYRITATVVEPRRSRRYTKEIASIKKEHAIEQFLSEIGSKHRAKRHQIRIEKVEISE